MSNIRDDADRVTRIVEERGEKVCEAHSEPRSGRVQFPIILSEGPKVTLTNQQIYELVPFP